MIVSINGRDGVGKSTHIRLLSGFNNGEIHATKSLNLYSKKWPVLSGKDFSRWWFETVSMEELIDLIIESLNKRGTEKTDSEITLFDRGTNMFKSVCVATWMTRYDLALLDAVHRVDKLFSVAIEKTEQEYEILLVHDKIYEGSIQKYRRTLVSAEQTYTSEQNKRYIHYQRNLVVAMDHYFAEKVTARIVVNDYVIEIQNRIRSILNEQFNIKLPILAQNLKLLVGYGGLSESGKSSCADWFRCSTGSYRLKVRYFIETLEGFGKQATADVVAMEILRFIQCHYYVNVFSVESLHRPELVAFLKLLLGNKFQVVYVRVPRKMRIRRARKELGISVSMATKMVTKKDSIKCFRGATRVKQIADIVLDNSVGSIAKNCQVLREHFGL
ncbi:MAG: hypothetical protein G01um101470_215 [Parcubacteria group bacterium Gr01-1014_70]|nr:MAG: hypothetical protein G01um101470_215 [Parcubacteria group bacterium Gr01-1014_70]